MKIHDSTLLKDLLDYAEERSISNKVQRVYYKAIKARKMKLAEAIRNAYHHCFPYSDMALALSMALAVSCDKKLQDYYDKEKDANA